MDIQRNKNENYKGRSYSKDVHLENRVKIVRRIFSKLAPSRVLDVACADGEILREFTAHHEIYGLDFTKVFVEEAKKVGIKAFQCDFSKEPFPFEEKFFDVVFSGETIEHIIDTDLFLSQINRVLKDEGRLIMTVPNIRTPVSFLMMLMGLPPQFSARYRSPHYRDFTLKTLKLALHNNGFEIEKACGASVYVPGVGETLGPLARFFPGWSSQMVLIASKKRQAVYNPEDSISVSLY